MDTPDHEDIRHPWDVAVEEAVAIQRRLAPLAAREAATVNLDDVRTVAGVDASYPAHSHAGRAAIVVFTFPELKVIEQAVATRASVFPYVPGLLSFREGPVVIDAMAKLSAPPDLLIFDGQGYAHPRRLGLASHLGLYLDIPSVGCAKSRLIGRFEEPGPNLGDRSPLTDRGETIGMVLRTRPGTKPLFVSPGYRVDLPTAVEAVLRCLRGYRLPET
ncbi:MAG TPA: deoxyribonuclease V, partial [Ktedonobacterales bacterium]|nr:deoxyribonuclease V [Ktedonobacterales bacterium]